MSWAGQSRFPKLPHDPSAVAQHGGLFLPDSTGALGVPDAGDPGPMLIQKFWWQTREAQTA
jgi:hypothetical protein